MSGIAAIIRFDGGEVEPGAMERMTAAMAYRGPDGIGHWRKGPAALGHLALRTTAEALEEVQPLANEDESLILVMDGWLSNWEELRGELLARGAVLRTRSDAELVLRAYEQWGDDCPRHIDGEFAFVVWDARRHEAFCARDHVGLRPLLYHCDGHRLVIASDMAAILAGPEVPARVNRGMLAEVMADDWLTGHETVWTDVLRLRPAHGLRASGDRLRESRYWSLAVDRKIRYKTDEDYVEHYRTLFADCVRRASRTHLPLAFEVSGGLDSSAIFCMAHHLRRTGGLPAPEVKGYTLRGDEGSTADEIRYARAVADHLGVSIGEHPLFCPELSWFAERAAQDLDLPPFPNAAMSIGLGAHLVADGCRVAINGIGGDQWLDGERYYYHELLTEGDWRNLLASFRCDLKDLGVAEAVKALLVFGLSPRAPDGLRNLVRSHRSRGFNSEAYWINDCDLFRSRRLAQQSSQRLRRNHVHYKLNKLDNPYLPHAFDALSRQFARAGYEGRSPMLARRFIEFSAATPEHLRLRGASTKVIHRRALAGLLPAEIVGRRSKAEFSITIERHQAAFEALPNGPWRAAAAELLSPGGYARLLDAYRREPVDRRRVRPLWNAFAGCAFFSAAADLGTRGMGQSHDN